jgi:DNA-binding response OmpR family regulator
MVDQRHLQMQYKLSPVLAKIMLLLLKHEAVTVEMIETDEDITNDGAVAVHRLRRRLAGTGVEIENVRGLGYFIPAEMKKVVSDKAAEPSHGA